MKCITIIGLESHTDDIVNQLRSVGVVHVTPVYHSENSQLEKIADALFLSKTAVARLPKTNVPQDESSDVPKTVNQIVACGEQFDDCEDEIYNMEFEQERISFLGDFSLDDISELEQKGIFVTLYELPSRNNNNHLFEELPCIVLNGYHAKRPVIAVVSYKAKTELNLQMFALPQSSPSEIRCKIEVLKNRSGELQSRITDYSKYRNTIENTIRKLYATRDFEEVRSGCGTDEQIIYLKGYCPVNKIGCVKDSADTNGWGLLIENPAPGEDPPTLLQNPRWVGIIQPIFTLLNTLPGYHELDISGVFLLFFSIFFGMIIGDAGYGTLFLLATITAHLFINRRVHRNDIFSLLYVLCAATILWGAVTGNWFGIEWLTSKEPFKTFIIPQLNAYTSRAQDLMIHISFSIAAVHLSLAHILLIFKDLSYCAVFRNVGWVMMVWVMFFIAQNQVSGVPLPFFFQYLLLGAGILIVLFSILGRKPGKNLAEIIIADILLATINTFADTISYIRLFAVGLATLAVSQSFNTIALQIGFGNVIAALGSALILIGGHSLNIALAAMAVIVHGIRLNMLEFSGHVGNTWSGYEYKPFQKRIQSDKVE